MKAVELIRGRTGRRLALLLALAVALALLALRGFEPYLGGFGSVGSKDFIAYWSGARLTMDGGNPYDSAALLAVERAAGWRQDDAQMIWNPPWTLVLTLPLALVPFEIARTAWLGVQLLIVLCAGVLLWDYYCPNDSRYWLGMLLACGFFPSLLALRMGQISAWMLLGVVGFLRAARGGRDLAAGAALALLMIKPHVTYLFWPAALWWAWTDRRRRVVLGWVAALIGGSALVLLIAPDVFPNYLLAVGNPPLGFFAGAFGTWLRVLLGWELRWLQFVPSLVGGLGLLVWLLRRDSPWHWEILAGPLLLASVATMAYGYSFDQVVLLPPVVALATTLPGRPRVQRVATLVGLLASQAGLWAVNQAGIGAAYSVWHAPVLIWLYWWGASAAQTGMETQ